MKNSDFIFDCVNLLHYKCHKINLKHCSLYLDSPDWMKNKKATINPINDDSKCFQYAATIALSHAKRAKNSQRISKVEFFINKLNWKGINYPSEKDDWKKFGKRNPINALIMLYNIKISMYPAYISKRNLNHEKQMILLMTPSGERWHYFTVKKYQHY